MTAELQLDDTERARLLDLARAGHPRRPTSSASGQAARPAEVQWTHDAITGAAAFVSNERLDILAGNQLGLAYSELYDARLRPVNTARFVPGAEASEPVRFAAPRDGLQERGPFAPPSEMCPRGWRPSRCSPQRSRCLSIAIARAASA